MSYQPRKKSSLILVLISVMVIVFSCVLLITFGYILNEGIYVPEGGPNFLKFKRVDGARMLGVPKIKTYNRVSEVTCMEKCDEHIGCMSATHNPTERSCNLFYSNATINPDSLDDESDKYNYFEKRYFWSRFGDEHAGAMEDLGGANTTFDDIGDKKECAIKCLNSDDPKCSGFNFNRATGKCMLLVTPLKGYEDNIDETEAGIYHEVLPIPTPLAEIAAALKRKQEREAREQIALNAEAKTLKIEKTGDENASTPETFVGHQLRVNGSKRFFAIILVLIFALIIFRRT